MDKILKYQRYNVKEIKEINWARLFHRVLTISDIYTMDGRRADLKYYEAMRAARKQVNIWSKKTKETLGRHYPNNLQQQVSTANATTWMAEATLALTCFWLLCPQGKIVHAPRYFNKLITLSHSQADRNTFITGFEVKPSESVTSEATKGCIYSPANYEVYHDRILDMEYRGYKLPDPMPSPANSIEDYIANQSGLIGLALVYPGAIYWNSH
jgi:hypothetical protein